MQRVEDVPDVYAVRYCREWISDIVIQRHVEELTGDTPLFIASQTGTGKTTFIFNNCLPVATKENKKVLYLCNRVALKDQIKKEAMKNSANKFVKVEGRKVGEYKNFLTDKGIAAEHRFGLIDVYTYQETLAFPRNKAEEYSVVIMDEAHFFLSDAPFNAFTEVILNNLIKNFQNTRRIYLSATPQESISEIYRVEISYLKVREAWNRYNWHYSMYKPGFNIILVDEDYAYLRPRFFEKIEEIADIICRDSEKKWLIFIRKKDMKNELINKLNLSNHEIVYYDAETDKELEQYKTLIENEELSHRVTISTKVLDVGINIKNTNVNIVIFEDDPIEIKQMIGRKRVKPEEKVLVYFYVPTVNELERRKGLVCSKREDFIKISEEYNQGYYQKAEKDFIYLFNGVAHINNYCLEKYNNDIWRYEELIDELSTKDSEQAKYVYAEYILRQFQLEVPEIPTHFYGYKPADEIQKNLKGCIVPFLDRVITKEDLNKIAENIFRIIPDPRKDKRNGRSIGLQSINKAIKPYGYCIEGVTASSMTSYRIVLVSVNE